MKSNPNPTNPAQTPQKPQDLTSEWLGDDYEYQLSEEYPDTSLEPEEDYATEAFGYEDYQRTIDDFDDTEMEDVILEFADDLGVVDFRDIEDRTREALAEYTLDEIFSFNEIDEVEALALLVFSGELGLPTVIEDEEVESVPPEEEES